MKNVFECLWEYLTLQNSFNLSVGCPTGNGSFPTILGNCQKTGHRFLLIFFFYYFTKTPFSAKNGGHRTLSGENSHSLSDYAWHQWKPAILCARANTYMYANGPFPSCCLARFRSESWCSTIVREMSLICIRIRNSFPFEWLCTRTRFETEACSNSEMGYYERNYAQ